MKSKVKNIMAVVAIILLVCMAVIVPIVFNKLVDSRIDKKVQYIEDETYNVTNGEEKSVSTKIEELSHLVPGRDMKSVYIPIYINEKMYKKIGREYKKWRKVINDNMEILETKFDLESVVALSPNIGLFWEANTDISFYVCHGMVKDKANGEAYDVTLYVDKDTYKILYMQIWSADLQQKVAVFWESGNSDKYQYHGIGKEGKNNITNFLKEYYNIQGKDFETVGDYFYSAKIMKGLDWNISETSNGGLDFGMEILCDEIVDNAQSYSVSTADSNDNKSDLSE